MTTTIALFLGVGLGTITFAPAALAQTVSATPERPNISFRTPEMPEGGGQPGLVRAIQLRVKYPMQALRYGIQGQSEVSFVVAPDGRVGRVKITRSLEAQTDSAVVRAVRQLPQLSPGVQFGKPVACVLTAPITFQLDGLSKLARSKRPVPAADSLRLYTAVEQMPIYQGILGYRGLANDLNAEYLRLRGESGCFVPKTNLGILVTVGPGGTLYDVQRVTHDPKDYEALRAEYGDAVAIQEEEELPPACLELLGRAARNLPRVAPAYANGKRVAMRLQLTLLAPGN
ncbi:energy transducer TonB [Hymenobacter armeniacus]|uniref:Energy transducer TonB n=1 Tax=Hymenobacter armeniacus TaxID=2771358 RepID=A0ABR8JVN8_9BACT|nr:energy transducer TonB [Hymenobacter armeniacus]MBD2722853.1 energy transducer TonB [Hymenobacter armeniacus]